MKVVCWHPVLTDHQSYTWEALQFSGVSSLRVFVMEQEHVQRKEQGWVNRHVFPFPCETIPARSWLRFCVQKLRADKQSVHIFGSPFERPRLMVVLLVALCLGCRVFLVSEPYSPIAAGYQGDDRRWLGKLKSALRPWVYRMYGAVLRRRVTGVLAISPLAARQYASIGIAPECIFPFGYFVPRADVSISAQPSTDAPALRLIFIGTLIARKGLDVLLSAINRVRSQGISIVLDVYGPGEVDRFSFDGVDSRYCGTIPFGQAQQIIARYDFLVLPSRYDGWGVVINEALLAGIPVICSDAVGASAVVEKWRCGVVFSSGDAGALAAALAALPVGTALAGMKDAARCAGDALDPLIAGRYSFEVLTSRRPGCPWYEI